MHMKELMKLRALHDKATEFFASLQWKKESFELLSHDEKIYSIVKNMEQMLEEVGETGLKIRTIWERFRWISAVYIFVILQEGQKNKTVRTTYVVRTTFLANQENSCAQTTFCFFNFSKIINKSINFSWKRAK